MARMVDADALAKAMGVHTYMQTEWTPTTAWGVPIVDAESVKHGHWTEIDRGLMWKCSECEHYSISGGHYCDWCGAKMDEVEE